MGELSNVGIVSRINTNHTTNHCVFQLAILNFDNCIIPAFNYIICFKSDVIDIESDVRIPNYQEQSNQEQKLLNATANQYEEYILHP